MDKIAEKVGLYDFWAVFFPGAILFVISPYHKRNGSGSIFPLGISSIIAYLEANEKI